MCREYLDVDEQVWKDKPFERNLGGPCFSVLTPEIKRGPPDKSMVEE